MEPVEALSLRLVGQGTPVVDERPFRGMDAKEGAHPRDGSWHTRPFQAGSETTAELLAHLLQSRVGRLVHETHCGQPRRHGDGISVERAAVRDGWLATARVEDGETHALAVSL